MVRWSAVALVDGVIMGAARSGIPDVWRMLAAGPVGSVDHAAATVCVAIVELAAGWLAVGLLAELGSALPGAVGTAARRVAVWALPRLVQRLLAGAVGIGVVAAPAAVGALGPAAAGPPIAAAGSLSPGPGSGPGQGASPAGPAATLQAPRWPSDDPLPAPRWPASGPWRPARPASAVRRATAPPVPQHRHVRVRSGDSLWALAARALPGSATPARVAAAWPRWWAANRSVIGADPNLLHPGEVLTVPAGFRKEASW